MNEFDIYADDYESALDRGISLSGESAGYFAKARIGVLARSLKERQFSPDRVLDFGCGTGIAIPNLIEELNAKTVIGVDVSERSLDTARDVCQDKRVSFQLVEEPIPNGTIDLAYCNGVFHHIPLSQRKPAIQSIADALSVGGILSLWENNPWSPAARLVMHRIPFDREAIMVWPSEARSLAESVGLRVISINYYFIFPNIMRFFRQFERFLVRIPLGAQYQMLAVKTESASFPLI